MMLSLPPVSQTEQITVSALAVMTAEARSIAAEKTRRIQQITGQIKILALNALIEATRAGDFGRGFGIVAQEVRAIGAEVETIAKELDADLSSRISRLQTAIAAMSASAQEDRLVDLALNAIELIDRNLYERTCDVRWWATDAAVVACAAETSPSAVTYASKRLGVILGAYTVYLDLWLCDLHGTVIANGRPERYRVRGTNVSNEAWFQAARRLRSGDEYVAGEIGRQSHLENAQVVTYCASVREGGLSDGAPLGILAIHFDWQPQAKAIVEGIRVAPEDRTRTRVLLVDAQQRIIAASDNRGVLMERLHWPSAGHASGVYRDERNGIVTAFHRTPGYETYRGLGWSGVIVQRRHPESIEQ